jgi:hypothetical protein
MVSETLLGVLIGGTIGVVGSMAAAVVTPTLNARHGRAAARADRVHAALSSLAGPRLAWERAILHAINQGSGDGKAVVEANVELHGALNRLREATGNAHLARATRKAQRDATVVTWAVARYERDGKELRDQADAADRRVSRAVSVAIEVIDPSPWPLREIRLRYWAGDEDV